MSKKATRKQQKKVRAYSSAILRDIRAAARRQVPDCRSVSHIFPRAYCVAKTTPCNATFAIPWEDSEPRVRNPYYSSFEQVFANVNHVEVGKWYALAYVSNLTGGQTYVINL